MDGEGSTSPAFRSGDAGKPSGAGLTDWCRALEARIEALAREKDELTGDNERLRKRQSELVSIIKGIEQAFIIGRLRSGLPLPDPSAAQMFPARAERPLGQGITELDLLPPSLKES